MAFAHSLRTELLTLQAKIPESLLLNEKGVEINWPGTVYLGPGTHVINNVINKIQPVSRTDAIALVHDVDYLLASNDQDAINADNRALTMADNSAQGLAMQLGLNTRKQLFTDSFYGGSYRAGQILKQTIKDDPQYQNSFNKFALQSYLENW